MLTKPPHGSPCNGCGGCCADQRCPLGRLVFGPGGRCPALEMRFPAFTCGLVESPEKHAPHVVRTHGADRAAKAAAILIGAGLGCDALLEGEAPNAEWRAWAIGRVDRVASAEAAAIWCAR
ncbi:hypothetical protein [Roseivivax isoporae]|uniref:hypothetical protein n=1 Tax=Roseivivax isoporae TaxID=591206 RepID=UPI001B7FC5D4|nr:hypothetical protein [Roseivivax isoporae]